MIKYLEILDSSGTKHLVNANNIYYVEPNTGALTTNINMFSPNGVDGVRIVGTGFNAATVNDITAKLKELFSDRWTVSKKKLSALDGQSFTSVTYTLM